MITNPGPPQVPQQSPSGSWSAPLVRVSLAVPTFGQRRAWAGHAQPRALNEVGPGAKGPDEQAGRRSPEPIQPQRWCRHVFGFLDMTRYVPIRGCVR